MCLANQGFRYLGFYPGFPGFCDFSLLFFSETGFLVQKPGFWTKIPQAPGTCVATQLLVHSSNGHAVRYSNGAALKPFEPGGTAEAYNVSGEAQLRNRKASQDVQPAAARTGSETRARKISCPPAAPCALLKKKSLCQRPIPKIWDLRFFALFHASIIGAPALPPCCGAV